MTISNLNIFSLCLIMQLRIFPITNVKAPVVRRNPADMLSALEKEIEKVARNMNVRTSTQTESSVLLLSTSLYLDLHHNQTSEYFYGTFVKKHLLALGVIMGGFMALLLILLIWWAVVLNQKDENSYMPTTYLSPLEKSWKHDKSWKLLKKLSKESMTDSEITGSVPLHEIVCQNPCIDENALRNYKTLQKENYLRSGQPQIDRMLTDNQWDRSFYSGSEVDDHNGSQRNLLSPEKVFSPKEQKILKKKKKNLCSSGQNSFTSVFKNIFRHKKKFISPKQSISQKLREDYGFNKPCEQEYRGLRQ